MVEPCDSEREMNTENLSPESLARIACLAAIELEHFENKIETSANNILKFSDILSGNFSTSAPNAFCLSDPLSAYAVARSFNGDLSRKVKTVDELIKLISEHLTTPLKNVAECVSEKKQCSYNKESIQILSELCLKISELYSSFEDNNDDFELHPYR